MELDLIHDLQAAYRKTIDSMSRPGLISNIHAQAEKAAMEIGCFDATLVLILMFLDTEVTFSICSERGTELSKTINQLTYARPTELNNADFILVLHDAGPGELENAMKSAYPGDLLNPHQAATVIVEVDSVTNERDLVLTGPGIEKENQIKITANADWVDVRQAKNSEYPMGIDLIFTDPDNNVLCLPRTTQITKQVKN